MQAAAPEAGPHANDSAVRLGAEGEEGGRERSRDRLRIARFPADRRYEAAVLFHARATLYELNRCHWRLVCLTLRITCGAKRRQVHPVVRGRATTHSMGRLSRTEDRRWAPRSGLETMRGPPGRRHGLPRGHELRRRTPRVFR